jgi:two-component system sensor histidine kinase PilS (NtrC family)
MRKWPILFNVQLSLHVIVDIAVLVVMMYASSGFRSGIGVMLLISLAGAALVSRGALMLFYAALASIALLLEQSYWVLVHDASTANFLQPGLLSIGYFATALITNQLALRVIVNERVARQRGADLANQLRINQLVIRDVQDGVLVVDSNGLVRQQNPAVSVLLGRPAPELDQIEVYLPELAAKLQAWKDGHGPHSVALQVPESGRHIRARFVSAGLEGGSLTLVFLEDLPRLQEQAQQLKLAALGRLTANIAHEIRNPLSAITHAGDLLGEGGAARQIPRLVRIIQDNARRLNRMVRDVLELSRRDRVQPQEISLGSFLHGFVEDFVQKEGLEKGRIALDVSDTITIEFDRVHLNQVIWNLVVNAWRHSTKSGACVRISAMCQASRLELHVIDDGPGVPISLQSQLFEPFFTTYSGGTGLGLYIARELCAANGASLDYVNQPTGAHFRVTWRLNP